MFCLFQIICTTELASPLWTVMSNRNSGQFVLPITEISVTVAVLNFCTPSAFKTVSSAISRSQQLTTSSNVAATFNLNGNNTQFFLLNTDTVPVRIKLLYKNYLNFREISSITSKPAPWRTSQTPSSVNICPTILSDLGPATLKVPSTFANNVPNRKISIFDISNFQCRGTMITRYVTRDHYVDHYVSSRVMIIPSRVIIISVTRDHCFRHAWSLFLWYIDTCRDN